eukprot:1158705-Pelagomonas_calceolata.AAC.3
MKEDRAVRCSFYRPFTGAPKKNKCPWTRQVDTSQAVCTPRLGPLTIAVPQATCPSSGGFEPIPKQGVCSSPSKRAPGGTAIARTSGGSHLASKAGKHSCSRCRPAWRQSGYRSLSIGHDLPSAHTNGQTLAAP